MTTLSIDHRIFGSGHGFRSPRWDNRFYWLNGELYTFQPGFGAQLHSVQWRHPNAGERRKICGQTFRPFHSERRWGRVMVAWAWVEMPKDIESANLALRELEKALGGVSDYLPPDQRWRPAQAIEAAAADETGTGSAEGESAVAEGHAPNPNQDTPMNDLIERIEAASGPDRELDEKIGMAVGLKNTIRVGHECLCPYYTASIDAALTLVPEGHFWALNMAGDESFFDAMCQADGPVKWTRAATPALALCAAALKSRAYLKETNNG